MENDIVLAQKSLEDIQNTKITEFDPEHEVSNTVVGMLISRIARFDREDNFNEELKDVLRTRLPEATWGEIANFLLSRESNETDKLRTLLAPFIPKEGDRVPLLDRESHKQNDSQLSRNADKETIRAFDTLTRILNEVVKSKQATKTVNATDVDSHKVE